MPSRERDRRDRLPLRPARRHGAAGDPAGRPAGRGRRRGPSALLNQVLLETLDLAHLRAVRPGALGDSATTCRRPCLAFNVDGDAVSTDLNPLTGRARPDGRRSRPGPASRPPPSATTSRPGSPRALHDPLWLLARQWQVGEFQGEDGGTPIVARWRGDGVAPLTRFAPRPDPAEHPARPRPASTPDAVPLETFVERQPVTLPASGPPASTACASESRPAGTSCGCSRPSRRRGTTDRRSGARYAVRCAGDRGAPTRPPSAYAGLVAGRALDGRRLRAALRRRRPAAPGRGTPIGDRPTVAEVRRGLPDLAGVGRRAVQPARGRRAGVAARPDGVRLLASPPGSAPTRSTSGR